MSGVQVPVAAAAESGERPLAAGLSGEAYYDSAGHKNLLQLIQLRWMAVVGQVVTIEVAHGVFGIALPLAAMGVVLAGLVAFNLISLLRWNQPRDVSNRELFVFLLVDVAMLTLQLYLSGGTTNPFIFLYLLQVILGAVLLETWSTWLIVGFTVLAAGGLAVWSVPLSLPLDLEQGLDSLYVRALLICFGLDAALLVLFITRISRNLRARDTRLADLRQRAAEEEHIVRMGLLASGAAHELGTPLATMSVILGDWRRMPEFRGNPEALQEIAEMQAQLQRCKAIVSGILLSAGEARGEASQQTTIKTFIDGLVGEWRAARPLVRFEYSNGFGQDLPVVSDSALKQMIGNVLDNALEASPNWLRLDVGRDDDRLVLTVIDAGPGFPAATLAQFGKPYNSTKGRPGGGLGLFLVVNVARTLGGEVMAQNRMEGGAMVRVTLPLSAIALGPA